MSRFFLFPILFTWVSHCYADSSEIGKEIYHENCATCHGREMQKPGLAFDLKKFPKNDFQRFQNSVLNGKGGGMPAWRSKLNEDDVQSLWQYVISGSEN